MGKLYLVRHGETAWNAEARYQGHMDTTLNEAGLYQAQKLQERFIKEHINAIFSSDLKRAVETASIIAKPKNIQVQLSPSLRELSFGEWEGLTYKEITVKYGNLIDRWLETPDMITIPGGEPLSSMVTRISQFINNLIKEKPEDSFVLVAHGGPIRTFVAQLNLIPFNKMWSIKIENASITTLETSKSGIITKEINNTKHLY
jgi:alpha-ribazole phosphatase